ncbi:YggU family protein [Candidatus Woesearchaeota archaeon]|nr:YggU family protein [Candidatus Woesearchaeota archaeon]
MEIPEKVFRALIKPGAGRSEILGFDAERKAYRIAIKAPAHDNKANKELIRFLAKALGRRVAIKSGFSSREKLIETFINE